MHANNQRPALPEPAPPNPVHRRRFLRNCCAGVGAAPLIAWLAQRSIFAQAQESPPNPNLRGELKAGAAKRIVTPPLSVPYLTSSGEGTSTPFTGVHDNLHARALVLDQGAQAVAVLAVDSIGYDNAILGAKRNFTAELRKRIAAATSLRPEAIMLGATHAHSAPETIGLSPFRGTPGVAEWLEQHLVALADTVIDAWRRRVPTRAFFGTTKVSGVARNRRILMKDGTLQRRGPVPPAAGMAGPQVIDEELAVLFLEDAARQPLAVLLNYAAHPVVSMLLPSVSADFPGSAAAAVEKALAGAVCLYTTGAAGNINSIAVSTSYDDVDAIGQKLGRAALAKIERLKASEPLAHPAIQTRSKVLTLDPRPCPPLAEAQQIAAAKAISANLRQLRLAQKLAEGPIEAEIQVMELGPVKWVSLPGEPFVEIELALKQAGASFVLGYANGYVGYLPVRSAYAYRGYETDPGVWSRAAPGSAERLEAAARALLHP